MGDTHQQERSSEPGQAHSSITTYKVLQDGQINEEAATDDGAEIIGYLHLVEGMSASTMSKLHDKVAITVPDRFFDLHRYDNMSQITDWFGGDGNTVLAKWTRIALQARKLWSRENRLRRHKTPFDVSDDDPEGAQRDHERYDHESKPYRSYHPLLEKSVGDDAEKETNKDDGLVTTREGDTADATPEGKQETDKPTEEPANRMDNDLERAQALETTSKDAVSPGTTPSHQRRREKMMVHAAKECISLYHGMSNDKQSHCILLFDPPRQHRITTVRFDHLRGGKRHESSETADSFQDDASTLEEFMSIFRETLPATRIDHGSLPSIVTNSIAKLILNGQAKFLATLSDALDDIELSMKRGSEVSPSWSDYPPRWRNHLFHQAETIDYLASVLVDNKMLALAAKRLRAMTQRVEGTYQVLMSAMSILESEKAIEQAAVVTRLTNLAFLFIPPTYVASAFGMNINEFDNKLTWWLWLLITIAITAFAYVARYRHRLARIARRTPSAMHSLRVGLVNPAQITRSTQWFIEITTFLLFGLTTVMLWFLNDYYMSATGSMIVPLALLSIKGPYPNFPHPFLRLKRIELGFLFLFFAAVAVSLWAVISSENLTWTVTHGLAYGIICILAFVTPLWWFVSTKALLLGRRGPLDDRPLITTYSRWHNVLTRFGELGVYVALGVGVWRLCESSLSLEATTGVLIAVGFTAILSAFIYGWKRKRGQDSLPDKGLQTFGTNAARVITNVGQFLLAASAIIPLSVRWYYNDDFLRSPLWIILMLGTYIFLKNCWAIVYGLEVYLGDPQEVD